MAAFPRVSAALQYCVSNAKTLQLYRSDGKGLPAVRGGGGSVGYFEDAQLERG